MKHQNLALITAMFALSACGAPQYSTARLNSEVNALSKVSSDILSQPKLAKALSGDFKNDLSKIVINSPEYIVSMSNYNRSLSEILVADADRELQISASANAGQTVKDGAGLASTTERGASANLSVSQLIFDGGSDQWSWQLLACVFVYVPMPEVALLVGGGHIFFPHTRH